MRRTKSNPELPEAESGSPRELLDRSDEALLADCDVQRYRASGPGGQHRNKVTSGVRLRHRPSGLTVNATERRSQHENRRHALRRLRREIALQLRSGPGAAPPSSEAFGEALVRNRPAPDSEGPTRRFQVSPKNPRFWNVAAMVLDLLIACEGRIGDAAARLDVSTGSLTRLLKSERHLLHTANELRRRFGHKPIQ